VAGGDSSNVYPPSVSTQVTSNWVPGVWVVAVCGHNELHQLQCRQVEGEKRMCGHCTVSQSHLGHQWYTTVWGWGAGQDGLQAWSSTLHSGRHTQGVRQRFTGTRQVVAPEWWQVVDLSLVAWWQVVVVAPPVQWLHHRQAH